MKALIGGVLIVLLAAGVAVAAEDETLPRAVDALACVEASDMPACLLKVLGEPQGGVRLVHRPVFFGRRDLLADAGITDARAEAWMAQDELNRRWSTENFESTRAVRDAVELDAQGASPERALGPIEALDISTIPDRHLYAYGVLAYVHRSEGNGLKPSRALVDLALSRWEAAIKERPARGSLDDLALQLATHYAELGDAAGAERAAALDKRQGHWLPVQQLTAQRRFDEAAEAARPTLPKYELLRDIERYRRVHVNEAIAAGRTDVAVKVAEHILRAEADFRRSVRHAEFALPIVHKYAGPERTAYWAERLDDAEEAPLALAAHWGWMAAGRPDRARQITERWLPQAREAKTQARWGRGGMSEVQEMLLAEGRLDDIKWFAMKLPHDLIDLDLEAGRGIGRLDTYLAMVDTDDRRRMVLESCATKARSLGLLQDSRACALRLIEINPLQGSLRALEIAEYAARLEQPNLMREIVVVGLKAYKRIPASDLARAQLHGLQRSALESYVTYEISRRPRE